MGNGKFMTQDSDPQEPPVSSRESLGLSDQVENGCVLRVVSPELGKLELTLTLNYLASTSQMR